MTPSLKTMLLYWLRLGWIGFGGPAGQFGMMHRELVEVRRWISEERFLHALNYTLLLPGPEATQLAVYMGWLMHGTFGGVMAGVLFVFPALCLIVTLSWLYCAYGQLPFVASLLFGIKPVVIAIIASSLFYMGRRALKNPVQWGIALAALIAILVFNVPFPFIVLGALAAGLLLGRFTHAAQAVPKEHPTVTGVSRRQQWQRSVKVTLLFLALWVSAFFALHLTLGDKAPLSAMSWFFTKASLLTFGGAYTFFPYAFQNAVVHHHWLTPTQLVDGFAFAQSIPGPLILAAAFIGYLGNAGNAAHGSAAFLSGALGALVAAYFTFLPSFFFILLGAPFVETTRQNWRFTAPLTALSASAVGVLAYLGILFAYHVFLPHGLGLGIDGLSVALTVLFLFALMRWRLNLLIAIALGLLVGAALSAWRGWM